MMGIRGNYSLWLCEDGMKEQWVQYGLPSGEGETEIVRALKTFWHLRVSF